MTIMLTVFAAVAAVAAALPAPQDDPGHCFPLDPGYGPVPTDNTPSGFLGFKDLSTAATSALTPQGFIKSSEDRSYTYSDASLYAGYQELQTYDPQTCADLCTSTDGCNFFQIFFERNPLQAPGAACPNPASTTRIKCDLWKGALTEGATKNEGHFQDDFQVVIAGSNSYVKDIASDSAPFTAPGFKVETYSTGGAIEAVIDCNGNNTYLGDKMWYDGKLEIQRCTATCATDDRCHFINTFIERQHNAPAVQHCSLYSVRWPEVYATNIGQYRGNDNFVAITNSYGLTDVEGEHEACVLVH